LGGACVDYSDVYLIKVAGLLVTKPGEFSGGFPSAIEALVAVVMTASSVYPLRLRLSEPKRVAAR